MYGLYEDQTRLDSGQVTGVPVVKIFGKFAKAILARFPDGFTNLRGERRMGLLILWVRR